MILGLSKEELFEKGHRSCAGCGCALAMRYALKAAGKNTIVCHATGCMEVVSSPYPETSWKVPWIHAAFENVAAVASGVEKAVKKDINVLAIAGDGGCYIPKTKILTIKGFKNVEDLKKYEVVWSVNPKTLQLEESKIKKMHKYNYNNKIVKVNHNFVHFDVSLNHNIPIYNKYKKKVETIKAYDLMDYGRSDKVNIITGGLRWKGNNKKYFRLPQVHYHKFSANKKIVNKIPMNLWLEFFGYWLSEGHLSIKSVKRERYNTFISQTNRKTIPKMKSCLLKLPFNYWYSQDRFIISNQQLWTYLKQFDKAREKYIPKEFKDLPIEQIKILFDSLIVGDGRITEQKNSKVYSYSTISPRLKDDIIEIALKLGYRIHLDARKRKGRLEYVINSCDYKPTTLANLRRKNISSYHYKGKIYCPELEKNHILIIEKDGRISLNMNSFDIGLQALSGAFERGHDICFICYANEAYMNTGCQRSGDTPKYADTTTTPAGTKVHGKMEFRKEMPFIVASHKAYVATANIAFPHDFVKKVQKGLQFKGPAYIEVYAPCVIGWKIPSNMTIKIAKLAFETKVTPLYEIEGGVLKLTSKPAKDVPVAEYLKMQGRFKHMTEEEINDVQKHTNERWERLVKLSESGLRIF